MISRLVLGSTVGLLAIAFMGTAIARGQEGTDQTQLPLTKETIRDKLNEKRITLEVADRPLKEVAAQLAEMLDVPIRIDAYGLDDVGLPTDVSVTFQATDVRAGSVLREIFRPLDLTYRIDRHGLEITTREEAEISIEPPLFYPVGDLIYDEEGQVHTEALAHLVAATLMPGSWEHLGGRGSLMFFGEVLAVLQTEEAHRQVSQLLGGLRSLRKGEREDPLQPITLETHLGDFEAVVQRIRETEVDLPNEEYPLDKLRDELSKATGLAIWIDARALDDVGLTTDTPIQGPWKQVTVERVLDDVFQQHEIDWIVNDGIVMLTTVEESEAELMVRIYPVADVIAAAAILPQTGFGPGQGDPPDEYDLLIDLLTSAVIPESWVELGGPGELAPFPPAGCLVVSQTRRIHEEVEQRLSDLRAAQRPAERENGGPERRTLMVLRTYFVQPGAGQEAGLADLATVRQRIITTIAPQAWEEEAYIDVYQGRIVVHQRADIHRRIHSYLRATGFYGPQTTGASSPRFPPNDQEMEMTEGGMFSVPSK